MSGLLAARAQRLLNDPEAQRALYRARYGQEPTDELFAVFVKALQDGWDSTSVKLDKAQAKKEAKGETFTKQDAQSLMEQKMARTLHKWNVMHATDGQNARRCENSECLVAKSGGKVAIYKRCSRCSTAIYCSLSCQKAAWPTHKLVCVKKGSTSAASAAPSASPGGIGSLPSSSSSAASASDDA